MALAYLLDENLRGAVWQAIQHHNANGVDVLDALRVGDPPAPPTGTADLDLLLWAESHSRILVTLDITTIPRHLATHLQAGRHSPGVFLLPAPASVASTLANLILHHLAGDPQDYIDTTVSLS